MLLLTSQDVKELVTIEDVIKILEDGYEQHGCGEMTDISRENIRSPAIEGSLKSMPAAGPPGLGGILYTGGWADRPSDAVSKLSVLFGDTHGELLCVVECDRLSWLRTGATSGVATDYCAPQDTSTLGIIGSGKQARSQLLAVDAVRDFAEVKVFSPTRANREQFASEMNDDVSMAVRPVADPRDAVSGCDVVCTATTANEPVFDGEWLDPGTHINAIGAHYPDQREVDTETVQRSKVIADALHRAQNEEGELIIPVEEGAFSWEDVTELGDVVCGAEEGRDSKEQVTLMTSGGLSMEYLVTTRGIYDRAKGKGVGTKFPVTGGQEL